MAVSVINFTTGPSTLPDYGVLSYNGCLFSPLFETSMSGECVKDAAGRTVKYMEYTLTADGYVTLPAGNPSINNTVSRLRTLLTAQGGSLVYQGRGFDLVVGPSSGLKDVAWGPVPELIEFQPLGGGKSAKIKWQVVVRISELEGSKPVALLQFNYETTLTYGEDYFSTLSVRGTMEVPITRMPLQRTRTIDETVDDFRTELNSRIFAGIDLSLFRVTQREFNVSRDKRTLEFSITCEEKPYMDMPPDCTIARGTYSVRPAKAGMGLAQWLCTLRATYTVRADRQRRVAWHSFLALLRVRMAEARLGNIPNLVDGEHNPLQRAQRLAAGTAVSPLVGAAVFWSDTLTRQNRLINETNKALLIDFSFDEGLYLDSKTISFSATWRIVTTISHILLASGVWKKVPERTDLRANVLAVSVNDVSGANSWLPNGIDPKLDVIVDFGGP